MKHSKGSTSLYLLLGLLYLLAIAQLMLVHIKNDYKQTLAQVHSLQERQLCTALGTILAAEPAPTSFSFGLKLQPNDKQLTVEGSTSMSSDGSLQKLAVKITSTNSQQSLNRWTFSPSREHLDLGTKYMFISRYVPEGASYISDSTLYTSIGSPALPEVSFLAGRAHEGLDLDYLHEYGFDSNFTYLTASKTLTYKNTAKTTKGNGLIASTSGITLENNFTHSGRLILISNASITIGNSVKLPNVLIIAKNNVNIGSGCTINGVIFAGSKIKIAGKGKFTHDATAVASYASAFYIA